VTKQPKIVALRGPGKPLRDGTVASALAKIMILAVWIFTGPWPTSKAYAAGAASFAPFDIHMEPSPADWRYFIRASDKDRENLWTTHVLQGVKLGDWSWGWRLGWVRACSTSPREFCRDILATALFDRALVVRAEAATRLGRRLEGSGDQPTMDLMARSYRESPNLRHGRPLYVQHRILFAIHRIGGPYAADLGLKLSTSHLETKSFWQKLVSAQG